MCTMFFSLEIMYKVVGYT